jgi:hypothetical protein
MKCQPYTGYVLTAGVPQSFRNSAYSQSLTHNSFPLFKSATSYLQFLLWAIFISRQICSCIYIQTPSTKLSCLFSILTPSLDIFSSIFQITIVIYLMCPHSYSPLRVITLLIIFIHNWAGINTGENS